MGTFFGVGKIAKVEREKDKTERFRGADAVVLKVKRQLDMSKPST